MLEPEDSEDEEEEGEEAEEYVAKADETPRMIAKRSSAPAQNRDVGVSL